jgi:uncharacterized alpha-E superfamily protein
MSRYTERAENTARMLSVAYETAMLPQAMMIVAGRACCPSAS